MKKIIIFSLVLIALLYLGFYTQIVKEQEYAFYIPKNSSTQSKQENKEFIIKVDAQSLHSSNLSQTPQGLMLLFFAGSREGAKDVQIYQSFFDETKQEFSEAKPILSPALLSKMSGKFIKKLGNALAFTDSKARTHFFVVGVSLGGWATSKIYQLYFDEKLQKLEYKGELKLSAFANLSHLIRNPALLLENKGFILPLYHELADKYPLIAFFDEKADFLYAKRLNMLKGQLQASIIALDAHSCLAFFRNHKAYDNQAFLQYCYNSSWQSPLKTNLKNYDSSSILVLFEDTFKQKHILLLHNDGIKAARNALSLYYLSTLKDFSILQNIDEGEEISYPSAVIENGILYIAYTFNRTSIKVRTFNLAQLEKLINKHKGLN